MASFRHPLNQSTSSAVAWSDKKRIIKSSISSLFIIVILTCLQLEDDSHKKKYSVKTEKFHLNKKISMLYARKPVKTNS